MGSDTPTLSKETSLAVSCAFRNTHTFQRRNVPSCSLWDYIHPYFSKKKCPQLFIVGSKTPILFKEKISPAIHSGFIIIHPYFSKKKCPHPFIVGSYTPIIVQKRNLFAISVGADTPILSKELGLLRTAYHSLTAEISQIYIFEALFINGMALMLATHALSLYPQS